MVFGPATSDTDGCFPTLDLLANPFLFGIFFAESNDPSSWSSMERQ